MPKTSQSERYSAADIEILSGLDPVRKRPEMFTDTSSPLHLAHEVIDNSVDESLSGHASRIEVTLHEDGSLSVRDDGRGMPVDPHPQRKAPGVEVILTTLHAGGKFSNRQYRYAGGLHGVGVSVVNALSSKLEVWIRRGGKQYRMAFRNGGKTSKLEFTNISGGKRARGTTIRFWPDPAFFDTPVIPRAALMDLLKVKAVLCSQLTTEFHDEAVGDKQSWHYEDGLVQYFTERLDGAAPLATPHFGGDRALGSGEIAWCVNWCADGGKPLGESYVNLVPTPQGGSHENGLRAGLTEALREFAQLHKLLPRGMKLMPDDVKQGLAFVLSLKLENPRFAGQTKERLVSREAGTQVQKFVRDAFSLWLSEAPGVGRQITGFVLENARARQHRGRDSVSTAASGPRLPGKLMDCRSSSVDEVELFLVEGDSAGGSAKQARDRKCQAVMPLRGKILNTWEVGTDRVMDSQEIRDIATAIDVAPGSRDLARLRYGKICILADADSDGLHISTLLIALFLKHFPELVRTGKVFVAMPPLFRIDVGKSVYYARDEDDRDTYLAGLSETDADKAQIIRFKGLGEMNPDQLRDSTMAPGSRRLVQLTCDDDPAAMMDLLLSRKRSPDRRQWLEEHGDRLKFCSPMRDLFPQNVIAVIWDFDKTLIPGYMQAVLFDEYGVDGARFWDEVNALSEKYRAEGCGPLTEELLYLNHILDYAADGRFGGLSNAKLKELGARVQFYPGLPEFFPSLRAVLDEEPYRRHGLELEHYVVSTGLRKLIEGSALAPHLNGVWGCEFLENESGQLARIGYVLDDTTKTRAIFEINKGVNVHPDEISVNDALEEEQRRVPVPQMIYVADGPSDVPVFSVVQRLGGKTFGVYNPGRPQAFEAVADLQQHQRVQSVGPADYRPETQTARWLERAVRKTADDAVRRREQRLSENVGPAPTHRSS